MNQRWRTIALWVLPIAVALFLGWQVLGSGSGRMAPSGPTVAPRNTAVARMSYGRFLDYVEAGRVTAVDISARRMVRVGENLARAGLSAELVTSDAAKWMPAEPFDAILLDAPCSGTGTLRRHPDIAWLKDEEDVGRLTLTQDRLLVRAVELLKSSGGHFRAPIQR